MKYKSFYGLMILVGLFMGIILAVQFRVTSEITKNDPPAERTAALQQELDEARQNRELLQRKVYELRDQLDQAVAGPELAIMKEELNRLRSLAGMTSIEGPGVEVVLNDNPNALSPGQDANRFILHDGDILSVLNELKAAGAQAISINNQRVIFNTEVRCIGPTILLNKNQRLSPPFVISALGNPDTLANSLKMKDGVVESLQLWGIQVDIKKLDKVEIPAYSGTITYNYAKPK